MSLIQARLESHLLPDIVHTACGIRASEVIAGAITFENCWQFSCVGIPYLSTETYGISQSDRTLAV